MSYIRANFKMFSVGCVSLVLAVSIFYGIGFLMLPIVIAYIPDNILFESAIQAKYWFSGLLTVAFSLLAYAGFHICYFLISLLGCFVFVKCGFDLEEDEISSSE